MRRRVLSQAPVGRGLAEALAVATGAPCVRSNNPAVLRPHRAATTSAAAPPTSAILRPVGELAGSSCTGWVTTLPIAVTKRRATEKLRRSATSSGKSVH